MTQEQKQLLLKDLCERSPYGVKVAYLATTYNIQYVDAKFDEVKLEGMPYTVSIGQVKPYLRPMSTMTEEEFGLLQKHLPYDFTRVYSGKFDLIDDIHIGNSISIDDMAFLLECLNKWHIDYRGLIPMGLALEAPEGMYNLKEK